MMSVRLRNILRVWWDVAGAASGGVGVDSDWRTMPETSSVSAVTPPACPKKTVSIRGVEGSRLRSGDRRCESAEGVTGGGAMERTSRPLCGASSSSRVGSVCTTGMVSSALTEIGLATDFRFLLLAGWLALEGEETEGFDTDGLPALQKDRCQRTRGEPCDIDIQFWYTIRVFFEKEANDLNVL